MIIKINNKPITQISFKQIIFDNKRSWYIWSNKYQGGVYTEKIDEYKAYGKRNHNNMITWYKTESL